ncbi:hypothetical protein [Pedobacter caeni]|uniref:Right handed beta helix region n=1 Tax=Pedobacter caeni TaxID=288992 RepID=A0A1M4WT55_9SPHI|nr:hypothetical protein [Pedobacter caeni]SHE84471.1 hypothetical protein SAMN04488522_1011377 [Pedobacter caeni]
MRLKIIALLSLTALFITFCSCKKSVIGVETPPVVEVPDPPVVTPPNPEVKPDTVIELGTGSGNLTIEGTKWSSMGNILIKIKSGSYSSINLKNLKIPEGKRMTIKNTADGVVYVKEEISLTNVKNLTISGNGSKDKYGFQLLSVPYRCIRINDYWAGVEISRMRFTNNPDYCISIENSISGKTYTSSEESRSDNIKILDCEFDNAGTVYFGGEINKDTGIDKGFVKGLEIAYCVFKNSSPGDCIKVGNVQDYNIHHNTFNNINSDSQIHNGIVFVAGNGHVHHNKCTNHQGNFVRAWIYSRGTATTSTAYDNIIYNSRKYSAFEYQGYARHMWSGKTTYSNAICYNNTVGKMNTSQDWIGTVIDIYDLFGGTMQVYNNVGINFAHPQGFDKPAGQQSYINNIQANQAVTESNNLYFSSLQEAGIMNESDFKLNGNSALKSKGKSLSWLTDDYYDTKRNSSTPSIGAVE